MQGLSPGRLVLISILPCGSHLYNRQEDRLKKLHDKVDFGDFAGYVKSVDY